MTSPTTSSASTTDRISDFEGYRGIVALLIVASHLHQTFGYRPYEPSSVTNALQGVPNALVNLFFLFSSLVLAAPFWRAAVDGGSTVAVRGFFVRRAVRLLPLYVVVISIVWGSRNTSWPGEWRDLLEHLTFTQTLDSKRIFFTVGPAWTLSVEVMFYVVLAVSGTLLTRLCRRLASRQARITVIAVFLAALVAVSSAWKAYALFVLHEPFTAYAFWFSLPAKLDILAMGMAIALYVVARPRRPVLSATAARLLRVAGFGAVAALTPYWHAGGSFQAWWPTLTSLALVLVLLPSALSPRERSVGWLQSPLLAWFGLMSYAIYLVHEPVLLELVKLHVLSEHHFLPSLALLVPVVIAVAVLAHWGVERPGLPLRALFDRDGLPRPRYATLPAPVLPAAVTAAPVVTAASRS